MQEPTTPIFFNRCAFMVPPERLYGFLDADQAWAERLGATLPPIAFQPGTRLRFRHPASGGILEAALSPRRSGSAVLITLYSDRFDRKGLEDLAQETSDLFDRMEDELERASDNLLPAAWPGEFRAAGTPPRILRRSDFKWKTDYYPDAPEDTIGQSAPLTHPLGVTQFGADMHRLEPGERNCRSHAELHEQEAFFVVSGCCQIEVEGQVYNLETGDLCVTWPGEAHFLFNLGGEPCEILCFGSPDVFGSGAYYPDGADTAWRQRVQAHFGAA
jgi:uncharacterized cupin superfamily protein